MSIPVDYQFENVYNSVRSPSTIHCKNTGLVNYFHRQLMNEAISVLSIDNTPDTFPKHYIEWALFNFGYCSIVKTERYGVIPQMCSIYGYNVFYRPSRILISNPLLPMIDEEIDTQAALIQLMPDYRSITDVVQFYADMMALTAESAGINLINSKLSYVFTSDNKSDAETMKKLYDQIASGNPATFVGKTGIEGSWQLFTQNVGQNYIADRNLLDLQKWHNMYLTTIGIPNVNSDKKERLITNEVNANNYNTRSLVSVWLDEIQHGLDVANRLFGLNLSVKYCYEEVDANGASNAITSRPV